eukprot:scaffold388_cov244-Pinguiococcus_pyrenoidosus.AAC.33
MCCANVLRQSAAPMCRANVPRQSIPIVWNSIVFHTKYESELPFGQRLHAAILRMRKSRERGRFVVVSAVVALSAARRSARAPGQLALFDGATAVVAPHLHALLHADAMAPAYRLELLSAASERLKHDHVVRVGEREARGSRASVQNKNGGRGIVVELGHRILLVLRGLAFVDEHVPNALIPQNPLGVADGRAMPRKDDGLRAVVDAHPAVQIRQQPLHLRTDGD